LLIRKETIEKKDSMNLGLAEPPSAGGIPRAARRRAQIRRPQEAGATRWRQEKREGQPSRLPPPRAKSTETNRPNGPGDFSPGHLRPQADALGKPDE
jgi:hypothetical protein